MITKQATRISATSGANGATHPTPVAAHTPTDVHQITATLEVLMQGLRGLEQQVRAIKSTPPPPPAAAPYLEPDPAAIVLRIVTEAAEKEQRGVSTVELREALEMKHRGQLAHHLHMLERERKIICVRSLTPGKMTRGPDIVYPASALQL
jgi:hypothetical protein